VEVAGPERFRMDDTFRQALAARNDHREVVTDPKAVYFGVSPSERALWEMFSDLMDLDDAHRYVADMLAGMDVRYDLGDDHRFVGTLCRT
jgi:hypothetical protein